MKKLSQVFESGKDFEFLNENEMQIIRGGIQPTKPVSRPKEVYDWEEE